MNPQFTILVLSATGKAGAKTAQILAESGDVKVVAEFLLQLIIIMTMIKEQATHL